MDTSVKQEVQSDDEFRRGFKNTVIPKIFSKNFSNFFFACYETESSEIQLDNIIGGEDIDETAVLLDVDDDDVLDFDEVEEDKDDDEVAIKQEPSENFEDEAYEEVQMEEEQFQESPEDATLTDKVCFLLILNAPNFTVSNSNFSNCMKNMV